MSETNQLRTNPLSTTVTKSEIHTTSKKQQQQLLATLQDSAGDLYYIYLAATSDLVAIVDIYNESILTKQSTADLVPVTTDSKQAWLAEHQQHRNRPLYVVKNKQHQVVAWGSFSDVKSRAAYYISSEMSIYVSVQYQRRNLASQLLQWMLAQAPSLGIQQVMALIFSHNTASLSLFRKFGFQQWGMLPKVCDMGDGLADVVIMGKPMS